MHQPIQWAWPYFYLGRGQMFFKAIKKPFHYDCMRIPPHALCEYAFLHTDRFLQCLNGCAGSIHQLKQLRAVARCFGKSSADTAVSDVRAIIPLPCVASALDFLLARRIHEHCDIFFEDIPGIFTGALPKTQVSDVSFSLQLLVERIHDNSSEGAIGQLDIKSFFDSVPVRRVLDSLVNDGFDANTGHGVLRFNCCLPLFLTSAGRPRVST